MLTEEMTVEGWWEDPSCHSPGSGESRDENQTPDDWILWGCLAVREAWSKFPVCLPGQSTDWSPSPVGRTPWNVSAWRPGSVAGCSPRFSSGVPDKTEINRKNRETWWQSDCLWSHHHQVWNWFGFEEFPVPTWTTFISVVVLCWHNNKI